jgi:OmpA-OmpF porin, OOP family
MSGILDMVKGYVTNELVSSAASALGENESGIGKAIGGLAPTILAGILNKSGDANAMGSIFNMLSDKKNAGFLDNLGGLIGGGNLAQNDPKDAAGQLMGTIFGNKVPGIMNAVSSFSGVKSSTVSSLMGLVGPMLMGVLSKKISGEGLNVGSFAKLLGNEKSAIMNALPAGMGSVLGLADMGNIGGQARAAVGNVETASTGTNWLWPLLALALAGVGAWWFSKGCNKPEMPTVTIPSVNLDSLAAATAASVTTTLDSAGAAVAGAAAGFMKKLGDVEIKGATDGIEGKLINFVESAAPVDKTTWFTFDRLTFETGSAKIDMAKSTEQLTNMVAILKAFPKVKLKLGGYTDNTGSEPANMKLSQARAESVMAYLVGAGIDKARIAAEGYASQHPVADNATEEGRAKNRRIDVRVTEK